MIRLNSTASKKSKRILDLLTTTADYSIQLYVYVPIKPHSLGKENINY